MTPKKELLIGAGILSGLVITSSIYHTIKRKKQNKTTSELLRELTKILQPTTKGILSEKAFDIHYVDDVLKTVSGNVLLMQEGLAQQLAKKIKSSFWSALSWGNDEEKIYSVFRQLKDKIQVAQVAKAYEANHWGNLIDALNTLSEGEVKIILDIVKKLPPYRTI